MWKLFRNLVLSVLLLTGGFAAALWAVAQQQATALVAQLGNWGVLTYASAGASMNGVLHLHEVHFSAKPGLLAAPISAAELQLRTPGALWLLRRALTHDMDVPEQLGASLIGVQLPPLRWFGANGEPGWINPASLVPFETFACSTAPRLANNDYAAMGLTPALPNLSVDYRYDAAARTLTLDLGAANRSFATVQAHAELSDFSPAVFGDTAARSALRADSVTLNYSDGGFFALRNQFCAKRSNIALSTFVEQHVAAVLDVLKQHQIVVAESLAALYRDVVSKGGSLHLLSLPNPGIPPVQYGTYDPEQMLRFLNLTVRHDDAPPVLFKLFFLAPEATTQLVDLDASLMRDPLAEPAGALVVHAQTGERTSSAPAPSDNGSAPKSTAVAAASSGGATTAVTPAPANSTPRTPSTAATSVTSSNTQQASTTVTPTPTSSVRSNPMVIPSTPVRPVIESVRPASPKPPPTASIASKRDDPALPTSGGRPAPNTTAALVWKGSTIERLPELESPREREFLVVAYETLSTHRGTRVTLITAGGKELEGTVESVEDAGLTLSVQRETGRAEFYVERARILEIRVSRPARG